MENSEIFLSNNALIHLNKIINEEQLKTPGKYGLRITIHGGGCSGFQYEFKLDGTVGEADRTFKMDQNIFIVIDEVSLSLVQGSQIDYIEDLSSSRFVINNPNAASGCGCGNSFSI